MSAASPEAIEVVTVYLRSASGASVVDAGPRALRHPERLRPSPATEAGAAEALLSLGLRIEERGFTWSVSGPAGRLELLFGFAAVDSSSRRASRLPPELAPWVEAVERAAPGVPFREGAPPPLEG